MGKYKKQKRWLCLPGCLLAACLLAGCMPGVVAPGSGPASSLSQASSPASSSPAPPATGETNTTVQVFLPAEKPALAAVLQQAAEWEGLALQIQTAPAGSEYTARLQQALGEEQPPQLLWLGGAADAEAVGTENLVHLANAGNALHALAQMVPPELALGEAESPLGLPVGYYGQGTLVNLALLAPLLGTDDEARLRQNLMQCSWEEWQGLLETIHAYLEKPAKMRVSLAETDYITPRYRPQQAQELRGIFAAPTAQPSAWVKPGLGAAVAAAFENSTAMQQAGSAQREAALEAPLRAFCQQLELETRTLLGEQGAAARGEGFTQLPTLEPTEAGRLFAEGRALLLHANSKTAAQLAEETPALQGRLALLPFKLPLDAEKDATNRQIMVSADGYLCLGANAQSQAEAQALLVRLFGSPQGQQLIENQLRLLPFSQTYPTRQPALQLAQCIAAGGFYTPIATEEQMTHAATTMGNWLWNQLMDKEEWSEEDEEAFLATALQSVNVIISA